MDFPIARQQFYQEIHQPEPEINVANAALYLAQEEYPDLEVAEYLNALDTMAAEVAERLPLENYPLRIIQTISQYLFDDLGFRGNVDQYYDPRNSYLNQVIERRTGIPLTLSLVYLEIAGRIDFPMVGVNMPGHFLIRPTVAEMEIFVDPFHQGEILFAEDCQNRLSQIFGRSIDIQPEFVAPVGPRQFLGRMLGNLRAIYLSRGELSKALAVIDRILLLFPDSLDDRRDRGVLYYHLGQWIEAQHELEAYLSEAPAAADSTTILNLLQRMQNRETKN